MVCWVEGPAPKPMPRALGILPSDTSDASDCTLAAATATSCAQSISTVSGASSVVESSKMSVEVAPFVAV